MRALPTHNGKGQTKGLVVRYLRLFAVWMVLAIVGGACATDEPSPPDVGVSEAGPNVDASEPAADTGVVTPLPDAGAALDAGLVVEAGAPSDAGASVDASAQDGGGDRADAGWTTAQLSGSVSDVLARRGLPNIEVCVRDRQPEFPCATTGGGGQFEMEAPADEDIVLVYSGGDPAIMPTLVHMRLPLGPTRWNVQVLSASMVPSLAAGFGQRVDDAKGHVSFTAGTAGNAGLTGVTGAIAPASGAGPFYVGPTGLPDRNAVQTTSSGSGTFINVDPGMINVSVTPQRSHECAPYGLAVTQDNAWRLPIVAGHLSIAVFECAAR